MREYCRTGHAGDVNRRYTRKGQERARETLEAALDDSERKLYGDTKLTRAADPTRDPALRTQVTYGATTNNSTNAAGAPDERRAPQSVSAGSDEAEERYACRREQFVTARVVGFLTRSGSNADGDERGAECKPCRRVLRVMSVVNHAGPHREDETTGDASVNDAGRGGVIHPPSNPDPLVSHKVRY